MDTKERLNLGQEALKREDYQEAINIFKSVLKKRENKDAWEGLGEAFYYLNDLASASWAYQKILQINPQNEKARKRLAEIELKLKDYSVKARRHEINFKSEGDFLYIKTQKDWERFFIKGINLGLSLPGFFPGEYPIKKGTYLKWFNLIYDLGINTLRVYTLQSPGFYDALFDFNHDKPKLFLLQGIWYEPQEFINLDSEKFLNKIKIHITEVLDAIHGNITLNERPGMPSGTYFCNVSNYVLGYLFGREPEACMVRNYNEEHKRRLEKFYGNFLFIEKGNPFEIWNTKILDYLISYSFEKYNEIPLVSVVNWITLDPIEHPTESNMEDEEAFFSRNKNFYIKCNENEDMEVFDTYKIRSMKNNFFSTYHIYPYYPDFMNYEFSDMSRPYLSYLYILKNHHQGQPLIVGEFGIPTSRASAHWHCKGWSHGGKNDIEQAEILIEIIEDIKKAKYAGYAIFSWADEWFKANWVFMNFYSPRDRKPFWFNLQDPEENYGLMETYPGYPQKSIFLDGKKENWNKAFLIYENKNAKTDAGLFKEIKITHDEGFLYILAEVSKKVDFNDFNYLFGIDTGNAEFGEFSFPFGIELKSPVGLKFLIHLEGFKRSRILVSSNYNKMLSQEKFFSPKREVYPTKSSDGKWNMIFYKTNMRRVSKDYKKIFSPKAFILSNLRFGSLNPENPNYDSLADFYVKENLIEIRLPWELLNFTDPSTRRMFWKDKEVMYKISDGLRVIAISFKPNPLYKPLCQKIVDFMPNPFEKNFVKSYIWESWELPLFHTRLKKSYFLLKDYLKSA